MFYGYIRLTDIMALTAARLTGTPVLFRGDVLLKDPGHGLKLRLREYYLRLWCQSISVALPVGSLAEQFYIHYGMEREKVVFAPYAVNNEFFFQECAKWRAQKADLKKNLGIAEDLPVILYVALMRPFKRPFDMVYAIEQLSSASVALVMVGGGPEYPRLESYCKQRKIRNVFLVGPKNQRELPKYYAMADIFVMPSGVGETWGLVINEAMCCGLPVIASNVIPSAVDLVKHGENGFIFQAGDVEELAGFLERLITDPILRQKMGLRSKEIISSWNYDADVAAILHALEIVAKQ
jgi:glycosyltransferase involved in cell wall biosynthesis